MGLWVARKVLRLYRFKFPVFQMVRFKWLPCLVGAFPIQCDFQSCHSIN